MTVYIVVEITKANRRPKILDIFDNPEEATKCRDYWGKGFTDDAPYEINVEEWKVKSEFKK